MAPAVSKLDEEKEIPNDSNDDGDDDRPKVIKCFETAQLANKITSIRQTQTKIGPFQDGLYTTETELMLATTDFLAKNRVTASAVILLKQAAEVTIPDGTLTAKFASLKTPSHWKWINLEQPLDSEITFLPDLTGPIIVAFDYNPRQLTDTDIKWLLNVANFCPILLDDKPHQDHADLEPIADILFAGITLQEETELWDDDYIAQTYCLLKASGDNTYTQSYLRTKAITLWKKMASKPWTLPWSIGLARARDYEIEDDILYHLNRKGHSTDQQVYVSNGIAKQEVFQKVKFRLTRRQATLIESHRRTSHSGYDVMLADLKAVWWDRIHQHIRDLLKACNLCDFIKTRTKAKTGRKTHFRRGVFSEITVDSCGPYRIKHTDGIIEKLYIIVFLCEFSQFIWLRLSPENTAAAVAKLLVFEVVLDIVGGSFKIRSDRGSEYNNALLTEVNRILKTTAHFSNAYHPASLSRNEHSHKFILRHLRTDAPLHEATIRAIQFAHRTTPKAQIEWKTPIEVVMARQPCLAFAMEIAKRDLNFGEDNNKVLDQIISTIQETREQVYQHRKEESRKRHDLDTQGATFPRLLEGSLVYLDKPPVASTIRKDKDKADCGFKIRKEKIFYVVTKVHGAQLLISNLSAPEKTQKVNIKRVTPLARTAWTEYPHMPRGTLTVRKKIIPGQVTALGPGSLAKFQEDNGAQVRIVDTRSADFEFTADM